MIINKHKTTYENDIMTIYSDITFADKTFRLWFKTSSKNKNQVTDNEDPFVYAVLFTAMRLKEDITVNGTVSKGLIDNLKDFQNAWAVWKKGLYHKINIKASKETEIRFRKDSGILAYSGGVDCTYTLWNSKINTHPDIERNFECAMMVHGFDIPLENIQEYKWAFEKSKIVCDMAGINLIPIATNLRDLKEDWEDVHAAALAACFSVFNKKFNKAFIASSDAYENLDIPWGSNPVTDPLLSNDNLRIIPDGHERTRVQKIGQLIRWPQVIKYIRFCWEGKNHENCGLCKNCVMTYAAFKANGMPRPECFKDELTDKTIMSYKIRKRLHLEFMEEIIKTAEDNNINDPWLKTFKRCYRRNKRIYRLQKVKPVYDVLHHITKIIRGKR